MNVPFVSRAREAVAAEHAGPPERTYWPVVGYAAWTIALFALFLLVTFPYGTVVQWALQRVDLGPLVVDAAGAGFAWHRGIEVRRVTLRHADLAPEFPPLVYVPRLYVRPALGDLLRGRLQRVRVRGELYGGRLDSRWELHRGGLSATARIAGMQLQRHPALVSLLEEGAIRGAVDAALAFAVPHDGLLDAEGNAEIRAVGVALEAAKVHGFGLPDLHFDRIELRLEQAGGRLEIQSARAEGPELVASASGQVVLREPLASSVLNIRATIEPGPNSPDAVAGLIRMIPRRRGARPEAPLLITGTIANPRVR